jgi:hypothetical protein
MKLSKKLSAFSLSKGCAIVPITYTHHGFHFRGFDVVKEIDGKLWIQLKIKPIRHSSGDRWWTTDYTTIPFGCAYTKNIGLVPGKFPNLAPQWTGFAVTGKAIEIEPTQSISEQSK